jgi:N-acetyl-alpha-D-muramate 1-phosphate uridylyltransferase
MQCVILAGGRGTRLGPLTEDLPKALVDVAGRPFLEYQLELLRTGGVSEIVLCVGYLGCVVERTIGHGSRSGLSIRYSHDGPEPLGTAGAIRNALPLLGQRFLVTYGDTLLTVDHSAVAQAHASSGLPALMTVLKNENSYAPSNAVVDGGLVVAYGKSPTPQSAHWIDYGLLGFDRSVIEYSTDADLEPVLAKLADETRLAAHEVDDRFYEIGDEEGLAETSEFVRMSPRFAKLRLEDTY